MLFKRRDESRGEGWRSLGEMSTIGMVLVASTVIGFLIGKYVGARFGEETLGSVIGTILGAGAGFVEMFRMASKYLR
jgi:F0F1-type ATP synthase assembly protein I